MDSFALVEASSPVLSIDRAKIEAQRMQSVGDLLPDLAGTRTGEGRAHSDKGLVPHDRDAQRADDARSLFGARLRGRFADTALWEPEIRLAPGETRAVAAVLAGELCEALAQPAVAVVAGPVAQGAGAHAHQPQGLAFAQALLLQLPHDLATRRHGHYFPLSTSRIASISASTSSVL